MVKTTKGEQSKSRLIECAAQLFLQKGYNATGINDILAMAELPKGSFYFHFSSKKDLAINVSAYFEKKLGYWIYNLSKEKLWSDFVNEVIGKMIQDAENKEHYGCPFAVLGLEIAFSEPDIADCYYKSMQKLVEIFASVFRFSGIAKEKVYILANRAFAVYEGYLLYYRIGKDVDALRMMLRDLLQIYDEAVN